MARAVDLSGLASYPAVLIAVLLGLGFLARFQLAHSLYLNPDEALIYFLSAQASPAATYKASLISAHPPLFYLLLYYWRWLGNSELVLRLPSVIAGTAFCWLGFKWLDRIAGKTTALVGLMFFCFTPSLVYLGAELRQYSLLLLFFAASLYWLETAVQENSARRMLLFSISLWLGILTQYSAWLFCVTVGIYALLRFSRRRPPARLLATWVASQAAGIAIYVVLYTTQFPWLMKMARVDKVFQGEPSRVSALPRETFRLFHYLFAQPVVGAVVLLLCIAGAVRLLRDRTGDDKGQPSTLPLACLLLLPIILSWVAALAHLYPFDGTRHSIVLAPFVIALASLGLTYRRPPTLWNGPLLAAGLLIFSYALQSLLGPHIQGPNQDRTLMAQAVHYVDQSIPAGSVILVDDQTTYFFRYYFCRGEIAPFSEIPGQFRDYACDGYRVAGSRQWMFTPEQLGTDLRRAARIYGLPRGAAVWLFQAGWNVNKEPALRAKLGDFGCPSPKSFGKNILVCRLRYGL